MNKSTVTAAEVMSSPVVAVTTEHSLAIAWETMRSRRVHHVAVLDERGLAGVLDDRELAAQWPSGGPDVPHRTLVGDILKRGVRSALPEQTAPELARMMIEARSDAVPVVTSAGVVVGLVTSTDLVRLLARPDGPTTAGPECEDASHG